MWMQQRTQSNKERNIPSAVLSLVFIVIVSTALAQPRWYYLRGGRCSRKFIGVQEFFFVGNFEAVTPAAYERKELEDCITPDIINVHRSIIVLCFLAILCALSQFFLDVIGVKHKCVKMVRRNAVITITSVILTVIVIGLCYYASEMMKAQQEKSKLIATTSVEVDFAVSYYLIIGAGVVGVIAVGANLLRCYSQSPADDGEILLDDCHGDHEEIFSVALPHSHTWTNFRHPVMPELPPPPPYTP